MGRGMGATVADALYAHHEKKKAQTHALPTHLQDADRAHRVGLTRRHKDQDFAVVIGRVVVGLDGLVQGHVLLRENDHFLFVLSARCGVDGERKTKLALTRTPQQHSPRHSTATLRLATSSNHTPGAGSGTQRPRKRQIQRRAMEGQRRPEEEKKCRNTVCGLGERWARCKAKQGRWKGAGDPRPHARPRRNEEKRGVGRCQREAPRENRSVMGVGLGDERAFVFDIFDNLVLSTLGLTSISRAEVCV